MKLLFLCLFAVIFSSFAEFPSSVKRCHKEDSECLRSTAQAFVEQHYSGLPELGLQEFDPLKANDFSLKTNPDSPIKIETSYKNVTFYGMKAMQILSINKTGDHIEFDANIPELIQVGNYKVSGNVLILPIVGEGPSKVVSRNVYIKYSFDLKPVEKNGKIYAKLHHTKLIFEAENVKYHLENLFNGDKVLGETMNRFLNENWKDIYEELKPAFSKMFNALVKSRLETVFGKYPSEEYFLQ
ncbi:protein takeout-like [Musca vetustissima]|uniref:protein takeout-like n=1 Tax=Musca vetustissima TaxID=27455 RepID=UPI002AB6F130|nr:protein takeout-like [Musca vetustissima]